MIFMEIEDGIWIAPEMVTAVRGVVGALPASDWGNRWGHYVEIQMLLGESVRCREHMDPMFYTPEQRPSCYLLVSPQDTWLKPEEWTKEKKQLVASAHAQEVQAQIAMYRTTAMIVGQ